MSSSPRPQYTVGIIPVDFTFRAFEVKDRIIEAVKDFRREVYPGTYYTDSMSMAVHAFSALYYSFRIAESLTSPDYLVFRQISIHFDTHGKFEEVYNGDKLIIYLWADDEARDIITRIISKFPGGGFLIGNDSTNDYKIIEGNNVVQSI